MVSKWHEWRDVAVQELLILGFVSSGAFVVLDWLIPDTRLRGVGLLIGMISCTGLLVRKLHQLVGKVWDAGSRAGQRRAELDAESLPRPLSVVRDITQR